MIKNVKGAYKLFKELLKERGGQVVRCIPENFGRHRLIIAKMHYRGASKTFKFYLVFQRKWFETFDRYFNFPSKACTLNLSILEYCVKIGVDRIVFVNETGKMLMISPLLFLKIAKQRKWIRKTKKTGEEVAHIPIALMTELELKKQGKIEQFFT